MSDRLRTLRRITKVQAQMLRIAEWKLAAERRKSAEAAAARQALDAFVNAGSALGPLADPALRQTQRLAVRQTRLAEECDRQAAATAEAQRRHKRAETATETVAAADRALRERRELEQLIDAFVASRREP